jgi:hypothetical protein
VTSSANGGVRPPVIDTITGNQITGTAAPGATIEIFSDTFWQGGTLEGRTIAGADGHFTFMAPAGWHAPHINATATDTTGSSAFTYTRPEPRTIRLPLIVR